MASLETSIFTTILTTYSRLGGAVGIMLGSVVGGVLVPLVAKDNSYQTIGLRIAGGLGTALAYHQYQIYSNESMNAARRTADV